MDMLPYLFGKKAGGGGGAATQEQLDTVAEGIGVATPSTPASIESAVDGLIADANEATGEADETLTDAVGTLIDAMPSGSIPISANGTYDVAQYASAEVNVPVGETVYWSIPNTLVPDDTYAIQYTKHIVFPQGMKKVVIIFFATSWKASMGLI